MSRKNIYLSKLAINAYTIETVTPGIASAILTSHGYKNNRKLSPSRVREYAEAMAQGQWKGSLGEPITLGRLPNGNHIILNGHHRMAAAASLGNMFPALAIEFKFMVEPCRNMTEVKEKYDFFDCAESSRKSQECLVGSENFAKGQYQYCSDSQLQTLILSKFPKAHLKYVYAFGKVPPKLTRSASSFRQHEDYIKNNQEFLTFFLAQIDAAKSVQKDNSPQSIDKSILSSYTSNYEVMAVLYFIYLECGDKGKRFIEFIFDREDQITLPSNHIVHRYTERMEDMLHRTGSGGAVKGNDRTKGVMFLLITLWNRWQKDPNTITRTKKGFPLPQFTESSITSLPILGAKNVKGTIAEWRTALTAGV